LPPRDTDHSRNPEPAVLRRTTNAHHCRGNKAANKLASTEGFTKDLPLPHRKLILFLIVVLSDQNGTLQTMYEAILKKWRHASGHWAAGKDRKQLTEACGRYIGSGASALVQWHKIVDAVEATMPEQTAAVVLTYAAGLYNEVLPGRPCGRTDNYTGRHVLPKWAEGDEPVMFDTIADWLDNHEPQLMLPSRIVTATTKRGPSGERPAADELPTGAVPLQPRRHDSDAADLFGQLEHERDEARRERDKALAELHLVRSVEGVLQEKLLECEMIAGSLMRAVRGVRPRGDRQPLEHIPLEHIPLAELQRRHETAQHTVLTLRQEIVRRGGTVDQDSPSDPPPGDVAAGVPRIGGGE